LPASGRFKVIVVISPSFFISIGSAIELSSSLLFPTVEKPAALCQRKRGFIRTFFRIFDFFAAFNPDSAVKRTGL
jgi:hypothetical protein